MARKAFIDPNESDDWPSREFLFGTELDALNATGKLVGRWTNKELCHRLGRRALEVAIRQAMTAADQRDLPDYKIQWEKAYRLASNSAKHLGDLIKFLGGPGTDPNKVHAQDLIHPLDRQIRMHLYNDDPRAQFNLEIEESRTEALRRAQAMLDARSAAIQYAQFADENRTAISNGKNPGEPEKLAFAETWSEAWLTFTGERPGRGSDRNPFARLVIAAWEDACGERDASFTQAVRQLATPELSPINDLPWWA